MTSHNLLKKPAEHTGGLRDDGRYAQFGGASNFSRRGGDQFVSKFENQIGQICVIQTVYLVQEWFL